MATLIIVLVTAGLAFLVYSQSQKEGAGNMLQFYATGKDAGFTTKDLDKLRRLAAQNNISNSPEIFFSQDLFERCIRTMVRGLRMAGQTGDQEIHDFLSKLYDYRTKLETQKPNKNGITNSRQISEGQTLKVLVQGVGVFTSQIVKNTSQSLVISRPVNRKITQALSWQGTKVSVYFWREGDAGYVFDAYVEDEVFSKGVSSLKISHNDYLFRAQKRKSVRIQMHKPAYLYLLHELEEADRPEKMPGLRCVLEDVSDTGCAVTVGGIADAGLRIKVQFALDNQAVCMPGTVRSVVNQEGSNRSLLRIEADTLPQYTRNLILGEVFGTQESYDDDLPFQLLDEAAASVVVSDSGGGDNKKVNVSIEGVSVADASSVSDFPSSESSGGIFSAEDFDMAPFDKFTEESAADKDDVYVK